MINESIVFSTMLIFSFLMKFDKNCVEIILNILNKASTFQDYGPS